MNKRYKTELYESIMKSVSKTVKRKLNESNVPEITNIITQIFKSNCNNDKVTFSRCLGVLFGYELLKCKPDSIEHNEDLLKAIHYILNSKDKRFHHIYMSVKDGELNTLVTALIIYIEEIDDINILVNKFNLVEAVNNLGNNRNGFLFGFFYYILQYSKVLNQKALQYASEIH